MFSGTLIVIIVLLLAIWFWQNNMRAKEAALRACKAFCKNQGLQLLDDTISLKKLRFKRSTQGWVQFLRVYAFEYNTSDHTKCVAWVNLFY